MNRLRKMIAVFDALWAQFGRRIFGPSDSFFPSSAITEQQFEFKYRSNTYRILADYRTPVYDTIAEIVDFDCYNLNNCKTEVGEKSIVIDAGANIGIASIVMADVFACPIIALEPVPANCEWLHRNISINSKPQVQIVAAGLAGTSREGVLWQDPEHSVSARGLRTSNSPAAAHLVPIKTEFVSVSEILNRFSAETITMLKMDIEGGEHEVVDSLTSAVAARIQQISMEVHDHHDGNSVRRIRKKLTNLGYTVLERPERLGRHNLRNLFASR